MPQKPQTTLTWTDTSVIGGKFRLIARQNRTDDRYVIEIYENVDGLEMPRGHLDRETMPDFTAAAIKQIRKEIKLLPLSEHSLMWLTCLNYTGLLREYAE